MMLDDWLFAYTRILDVLLPVPLQCAWPALRGVALIASGWTVSQLPGQMVDELANQAQRARTGYITNAKLRHMDAQLVQLSISSFHLPLTGICSLVVHVHRALLPR